MVVIGIDAHKRTHTAVIVDHLGRKVAVKTTGTTSSDHLGVAALGHRPGGRPGMGD